MNKNQKYQHFAVVGICVLLVGISMAMVQYKVPTIMTSIMDKYELSAAGGSWLMSIFTLMSVFSAVLFGILSQKFSPKKIIVFATAIIVLGSVIGAFSGVGWLLIASRALEGIALTAVTTCGPIIIQKCVEPNKIGSALGIWGVWGPLGSVIAGLITPSIFENLGLSWLWILYAVLVIVATTVMYLVVKEPNFDCAGTEMKTQDICQNETDQDLPCANSKSYAILKPRYKELFNRNTVLFLTAFICFNVILLAVLSFVPTILQMQGFSQTLSGFVSTLPMLLCVISSPVFGMLSDKTGQTKWLLTITLLFLGPCAFVLYTQTGILMWIAAILMGIIGMGSSGLVLAAFMKVLPRPELVSIGMGVLITVQGIGQFLGTFLVQALLGSDLSNWFSAGFIVMLIGILGAVSVCFTKMKSA